jgi:hypothetical protein
MVLEKIVSALEKVDEGLWNVHRKITEKAYGKFGWDEWDLVRGCNAVFNTSYLGTGVYNIVFGSYLGSAAVFRNLGHLQEITSSPDKYITTTTTRLVVATFSATIFSFVSGSYFTDQTLKPCKKKKSVLGYISEKAFGKVEQLEPAKEPIKYQSIEDTL